MELTKVFVDKNAAQNGKWFPLGDGEVKVRRWNNPHTQALDERLKRPYRTYALSGRTIPPTKLTEITIELIARTILLDWRGDFTVRGKPFPYSPENAEYVLNNSEWFRDQVARFAIAEENWFQEETEEIAKNSATESSGNSPGAIRQDGSSEHGPNPGSSKSQTTANRGSSRRRSASIEPSQQSPEAAP